ncbi:hypothetical protein Tco_1042319 [Tanacetum coccineum]|uniref:Retrovirus-related Pol polyprotein from transposon TNT 1-94-like beta-barrel domain-containing protein n=1 Tax=Tanacetum coccineum TaxID=301880 RepID=A0ABQ5GJH3_9ASTR
MGLEVADEGQDKFEGVDFRRWQKKMHFFLYSMSVVYVLTTPIPEDGENATVEQLKKRSKWDNDDYACRGLILNGMSDSLFDIYQNVESSKELCDLLEAKYIAEDASSKNFLVSNFTNYKMIDSRPVMEQYNELLGILRRFIQHKMNMDEAIQDNDKPRAIVQLVLQLSIWWSIATSPGIMTTKMAKVEMLWNKAMVQKMVSVDGVITLTKRIDDVAWWVDSGAIVHVCKDRYLFKTYESLNNGSILHMINESTALVLLWAVVKSDSKANNFWVVLCKRGWNALVGSVEHSRLRLCIEPNDSVSINIIESNDVIFDENKFSSVPKLSLRIPNGTEDIGGSVVPEEVTEKVVQQPESELEKPKGSESKYFSE